MMVGIAKMLDHTVESAHFRLLYMCLRIGSALLDQTSCIYTVHIYRIITLFTHPR